MSGIATFVLLLWSLLGVDVELHHVDGPVHFTDLYGHARLAPGALACPSDGPPQLWLSNDAPPSVVAHELAHALDCSDDGDLNGSPGDRPHDRPAWVSDYCWSSDAEWYACSVTRAAPLAPRGDQLAAAPTGRAELLPIAGAAPSPLLRARCAASTDWSPDDLLGLGANTLPVPANPACEG